MWMTCLKTLAEAGPRAMKRPAFSFGKLFFVPKIPQVFTAADFCLSLQSLQHSHKSME